MGTGLLNDKHQVNILYRTVLVNKVVVAQRMFETRLNYSTIM